jgi:hypothetical protein
MNTYNNDELHQAILITGKVSSCRPVSTNVVIKLPWEASHGYWFIGRKVPQGMVHRTVLCFTFYVMDWRGDTANHFSLDFVSRVL